MDFFFPYLLLLPLLSFWAGLLPHWGDKGWTWVPRALLSGVILLILIPCMTPRKCYPVCYVLSVNLYQHGNPILCLPLLFQTLRLSNSAIGKTTTGQIVNMMSNDVNRFDRVSDQGILFISHWVQLFGMPSATVWCQPVFCWEPKIRVVVTQLSSLLHATYM